MEKHYPFHLKMQVTWTLKNFHQFNSESVQRLFSLVCTDVTFLQTKDRIVNKYMYDFVLVQFRATRVEFVILGSEHPQIKHQHLI